MALLLDVWLPGIDGRKSQQLRANSVDRAVVMISGHCNIENGGAGNEAGRVRLYRKAALNRETVLTSATLFRQRELSASTRYSQPTTDEDMRWSANRLRCARCVSRLRSFAAHRRELLIYGESEPAGNRPRAIHFHSRRVCRSLHRVNSAAIPEELIESECSVT